VPLYDTLGDRAIEFIITHSETTCICVAANKLAALAKSLPKVGGQIKTVVCWGAANQAVLEVRITLATLCAVFEKLQLVTVPVLLIWMSLGPQRTPEQML
jgi:long-chain acyl-CoA synthetase